MYGHISLHRKVLDNPVVCKDADHLAVWIYLLCNAAWKPVDVMFHGERISLSPGQLTTGRKTIAEKLHISESKVQRILKLFENEHQIEQRTDRQCRLITIVSWDIYQASEQRYEQRVNNDRTTSEQRVNTKEESNKDNKDNKDNNNKYINIKNNIYKHPRNIIPPSYEMVQEYILENGYRVDVESFMDYYESKGWLVGKAKMKDWQAAVRNWSRHEKKPAQQTVNPFTEMRLKGEIL